MRADVTTQGKTMALAIAAGIGFVAIAFVSTHVLDSAYYAKRGSITSGGLAAPLPLPSGTGDSLPQPSAGQNLLWPSADFTNPKWTHYQLAAIEPAAAKAPDGAIAATRLVESSDNGKHFIVTVQIGAQPKTIQTFSVYFNGADRSIWLEMRDDNPGKYGTALCNLPGPNMHGYVNKSGDALDGGVDDVGDGWYRCWAAMPYDRPNVVLAIELRNWNGNTQYRGNGHSGVLIWGAQFEPGNRPSAYAATTTAPVMKIDRSSLKRE